MSLLDNFLDLDPPDNEGLNSIKPIGSSHSFFLSKDEYEMPLLLINTGSNEIEISDDITFKALSINDLNVNYISEESNKNSVFTIIKLNHDSQIDEPYFLNLFINLCEDIPNIIGEKPTKNKIKDVFYKFGKLFSKNTTIDKNKIIGLWGELLVIYISNNPKKLIDAWHANVNEKIDFSFHDNKSIEIKTTTQNKRIHNFNLDQIDRKNQHFVVSIMLDELTGGKSILDLKSLIIELIKNDAAALNKFNKVFSDTFDNKFSKEFFDLRFDLQNAIESIRLYESIYLPKIQKDHIPQEISKVKIEADLTFVNNFSTDINSYEK